MKKMTTRLFVETERTAICTYVNNEFSVHLCVAADIAQYSVRQASFLSCLMCLSNVCRLHDCSVYYRPLRGIVVNDEMTNNNHVKGAAAVVR